MVHRAVSKRDQVPRHPMAPLSRRPPPAASHLCYERLAPDPTRLPAGNLTDLRRSVPRASGDRSSRRSSSLQATTNSRPHSHSLDPRLDCRRSPGGRVSRITGRRTASNATCCRRWLQPRRGRPQHEHSVARNTSRPRGMRSCGEATATRTSGPWTARRSRHTPQGLSTTVFPPGRR